MQRPGKCCEECVSSKGSCLDGSTVRYHGEMWNSTHCDFCVCQEGQVTCQAAECAKVECAKVRKAFFSRLGILNFFPLPFSFFFNLRRSKNPPLFCAVPSKTFHREGEQTCNFSCKCAHWASIVKQTSVNQ